MTEYRQFVDMLVRAGIGHGLRHDAGGVTAVLVENGDMLGPLSVAEFSFGEEGLLESVHIYDGEEG